MDQIPSIATIISLVVGGLAGFVAARLMKRRFFGELFQVVLGMAGGFVGAWIWTHANPWAAGGLDWLHTAGAAAVGSVVLLLVWRLATR